MVTGANTGLGREMVRHLVNLGASKVILGSRSLSKGLAAKEDIGTTTGRLGIIKVWGVDLESFDSVKAFPSRAKGLKQIDVVVNTVAPGFCMSELLSRKPAPFLWRSLSSLLYGRWKWVARLLLTPLLEG